MLVVELKHEEADRGAERGIPVPIAEDPAPITGLGTKELVEMNLAALAPGHARVLGSEKLGVAALAQAVQGQGMMEAGIGFARGNGGLSITKPFFRQFWLDLVGAKR